nr:hypothetical protein [uncultured bacterium]
MWGVTLSGPLPIVALVSRYLTNKLMGRMPISYRNSLITETCESVILWSINPRFQGLFSSMR